MSKSILLDLDGDGKGTPFGSVITNPLPPQEKPVEEPKVETQPQSPPENPEQVDLPQDVNPESPQEETPEADTDISLPEQEQEEVVSEEQEETEEEVNPFYFLAQDLKQKGRLKEDLEITESIDGLSVYNAYEEKLRADIEPNLVNQIKREAETKLYQDGYDGNDLILARALRSGVDHRLLSEKSMHERFSQVSIDDSEDIKLQSVKAMYASRGWTESESNEMIESAKSKESLDDLFSESKAYHKNKWSEFVVQENQRAEEQERQFETMKQEQDRLIKTMLSSKEVLGETFSDEQSRQLHDSFYVPNAVLDWNGEKYNMTEFQKFTYETQMNPELVFWLFKKYKFRDQENEVIKSQIKKEVEQDFVSAYKTSVLKDKKPSEAKKVVKKLEENKQNSPNRKTYFFDREQGLSQVQ